MLSSSTEPLSGSLYLPEATLPSKPIFTSTRRSQVRGIRFTLRRTSGDRARIELVSKYAMDISGCDVHRDFSKEEREGERGD